MLYFVLTPVALSFHIVRSCDIVRVETARLLRE
jgi:hypothetical protein